MFRCQACGAYSEGVSPNCKCTDDDRRVVMEAERHHFDASLRERLAEMTAPVTTESVQATAKALGLDTYTARDLLNGQRRERIEMIQRYARKAPPAGLVALHVIGGES